MATNGLTGFSTAFPRKSISFCIPKPELSLAPVAARLTELLGQEVKFAADAEVVGPNAKAAVEAMKDGDIVLLCRLPGIFRSHIPAPLKRCTPCRRR